MSVDKKPLMSDPKGFIEGKVYCEGLTLKGSKTQLDPIIVTPKALPCVGLFYVSSMQGNK